MAHQILHMLEGFLRGGAVYLFVRSIGVCETSHPSPIMCSLIDRSFLRCVLLLFFHRRSFQRNVFSFHSVNWFLIPCEQARQRGVVHTHAVGSPKWDRSASP